MHTNGNGEVAFWRICGGGPPFWKGGNKGSQASTTTKYYYKQKGEVKYSTWLLWLGANNPTPGLRKTLTAPASRRGPWSLGACALGAPTSGGEKSASSAKDISDLFRGS